MKKNIKPKKIIRYAYLSVGIIIVATTLYLYTFFKKNVYESLFFDHSKYLQTASKDNDINMAKFNEVIDKIDAKQKTKKNDISDMFK